MGRESPNYLYPSPPEYHREIADIPQTGPYRGMSPAAMIERWGPHVPALSLVSPYAAPSPLLSPMGPHYRTPLSPTSPGFYSTALFRHPFFHPAMVPYDKAPLSPFEGHDLRKTSIEDLRHKARRHSASMVSPKKEEPIPSNS